MKNNYRTAIIIFIILFIILIPLAASPIGLISAISGLICSIISLWIDIKNIEK